MELSDFNDTQLFALLIAGECGGEPLPGQVAVAQTVIERKYRLRSHYGFTFREIMLKPYQYSTFNGNTYWRTKTHLIDYFIPLANLALYADYTAIKGLLNSPCPTATHFHNKYLRVYPTWSKPVYSDFLMTIGLHRFYREK